MDNRIPGVQELIRADGYNRLFIVSLLLMNTWNTLASCWYFPLPRHDYHRLMIAIAIWLLGSFGRDVYMVILYFRYLLEFILLTVYPLWLFMPWGWSYTFIWKGARPPHKTFSTTYPLHSPPPLLNLRWFIIREAKILWVSISYSCR